MNKYLLALPLLAASLAAPAQTVLLNETFNDNDYTKSFPYTFDGDNLMPHPSVQAIFLSAATGSYQPWWVVKDASTSPEVAFASHSMYQPAGQSNDWLISIPLNITTTGFKLDFDAQSLVLSARSTKLSDLSLYVTEALVDPDNLPTQPDTVFAQIPLGEKFDEFENDWTHYSVSLDRWAGKTIYLNFVNQNFDKELLLIDNIRVARINHAEVLLPQTDFVTADEAVEVPVTVKVVAEDGITNYALTLAGETKSGAHLAKGDHTFTFTLAPELDHKTAYTAALTADGMPEMTAALTATRQAFMPLRKVMIEETTGAWCGNCPLGIYNMEQMLADEEMGKWVIPVAVHISGSGFDKMVYDGYGVPLGINLAPTFTINRNDYVALTTAHDANFDKTDPLSLAYSVQKAHEQPTAVGVSVSGDWVIEGGDTVAVDVTAKVRAALSSNSRYRVGFIMLENNVGLDESKYWLQQNYFSGNPYASELGGWTKLPKVVKNYRWQDVSRVLEGFEGVNGSLPDAMEIGGEYTAQTRLLIPVTDEYVQQKDATTGEMIDVLACPPVSCQNLEVVAFVFDTETGRIANADVCPMSPEAEKRMTTADLVARLSSGIESVKAGNGSDNGPYYDLSGRRVEKPGHGVYIRGGRKIVF